MKLASIKTTFDVCRCLRNAEPKVPVICFGSGL
jgi:hypothetical protein